MFAHTVSESEESRSGLDECFWPWVAYDVIIKTETSWRFGCFSRLFSHCAWRPLFPAGYLQGASVPYQVYFPIGQLECPHDMPTDCAQNKWSKRKSYSVFYNLVLKTTYYFCHILFTRCKSMYIPLDVG